MSDSNAIIQQQQEILAKNLKRFSTETMIGQYEELFAALETQLGTRK